MRFARAIWKLLVGIKDTLVLVFMLLFFGLLYAGLSASPKPVGDGVLAFELDRPVVEQPAAPLLSDLASGVSRRDYRLRDLIASLDAAKDDSRVKAVALDLDNFSGGGQAALTDLAEAIKRVRASGKPVIAYATGYTDDGYLLASAASEIWLNPLGAVVIAGPGASSMFYKGLLDKLGVTANVYRVGTYKSAVEPYIRSDMSPEAKANYQGLADALLERWRETVLSNRPKARVDLFLRDMPAAVQASGGDFGRAALAAGLVDKLATRRAFESRMAELGGNGERDRDSYARIPLDSYVRAKVRNTSGPIGVVTVAGMIVDGTGPEGQAAGDSVAKVIETAIKDDDLKALVVRVDSPGGSVTASERIRQALLAAKEKKLPVVVSMGNVAASGGYWISTPANFIYADPATLTGSIGVFGVLPSFQGTLDKLGIGVDGVRTTSLSGEPDLLKGPSPEVNQLLQAGVESTYRQFLSLVAQSRGKSLPDVDRIAQGRVWAGGAARQIGLVDGFGGMDEAIEKAAELAKLDEGSRDVRYLERPKSFTETLMEMIAGDETMDEPQDAFAAFRGNGDRLLAHATADARMILNGPTIQARCLECPVAPAALKRPMAESWVTLLLGLLS